jgi:hypothetical protein
MMPILRVICFIVLTLMSNKIFSQWIKLPAPTIYQPVLQSWTSYFHSPDIITPIGNNKLIFSAEYYASPSSGGYNNIYQSIDNLNISNCLPWYCYTSPNSQWATTNNINSLNDSSFAFFRPGPFGWELTYTYNNYQNFTTINMGGPYSTTQVEMTKNHIFVLANFGADSLILKKRSTTITPTTTNYSIPNCSAKYSTMLNFLNDSTGFAIVTKKNDPSKTILIKTIDSGENWSEIFVESSDSLTSFSFPNLTIGFLSKRNGTILKTTDGGATWIPTNSPVSSKINTIVFSNSNNGFIGGLFGVKATVNGGVSWTNENTLSAYPAASIYLFDSTIYMVNTVKEVFKKGFLITNISSKSEDIIENIEVFPNPSEGSFTLKLKNLSGEKVRVSLNDIIGNHLFSSEDNINESELNIKFNIDNIKSGTYYITVLSNDNIYKKKLLIIK